MDTFDFNGLRIPKQKKPAAPGFQPIKVCPFTVLVDTREQLPYDFSGITDSDNKLLAVPKRLTALVSGDYSLDDYGSMIVAVERKSLDDLYGSVTHERKRFEHEICRLNVATGFAAVVIEADWREIVAPSEHRLGWVNRTNPRSVEGTIAAWSIRYPRVHWWACGDRRGGELRTFAILKAFWNEQQKKEI